MRNPTGTEPIAGGWKLPAAIAAAALAALYAPTLQSLFRHWAATDDASHGFLVAPISLYLLYRKREAFREMEARGDWKGLLLLTIGLLLYLFSRIAGILTLSGISLLTCLAGAVLFLYGPTVFGASLFPLAFLIFMLPVPTLPYAMLTSPLQNIVARFSAVCVSLLGVPVLLEGNVIHLPTGALEVVAACSGLRSLMTLLMLGVLLGYLRHGSYPSRGILLAAAVPIAVSVNVVRVTAIAVARYHFGLDLLAEPGHTAVGMAVFVLALASIYAVSEGLTRWERKWSGAR